MGMGMAETRDAVDLVVVDLPRAWSKDCLLALSSSKHLICIHSIAGHQHSSSGAETIA